MAQSATLRCGRRVFKSIAVIAIASAVFAGCSAGTAFERLTEAKRLSADLFIQFTSNAANQAVMADTDEASIAFAKQAEEIKKQVQADIDALRPVPRPQHAETMRLLEEFVKAFTEYRYGRRILSLAVQALTQAQRPPFGVAPQAADASRKRSTRSTAFPPPTRGKSGTAAGAVADLRAIQVAQAPHIAEADDAVIARIEQQMGIQTRQGPRWTRYRACLIVDATTGRGAQPPSTGSRH
jgi:hypothetical protein